MPSEDEPPVGAVNRLRRRLAYWLLPGTNEFDVAMTRQTSIQLLDHLARHEDNSIGERAELEARNLAERLPVRPGWDNSDTVIGDA